MVIALRPQPVGLWDPPAAFLLLPAAEAPEAHAALLRGKLPEQLPRAWRFFALAVAGDTSAALEHLVEPTDPLTAYNRFVLAPSVRQWATLQHAWPEPLDVLFHAVGYYHGYTDRVPEPRGLRGELRAVVLAAAAAAALEAQRPFEALERLEQAIAEARTAVPVLAARLICQAAQLILQQPGNDPHRAALLAREGLQLAGDSPLPLLQAQLWLHLGLAYHHTAEGRRSRLLEAVRCYQKALHHGIDKRTQPELYALVQNHLGLAYMAMPAREASDQLRMGIAVQAFREAVAAYDRDKTPDLWASAQMNLANALQYLPSSHPAENLAQAVEAYEQVLQVRDKALDPVGYARTLLNQANALAHLGQLRPALDRAAEARTLLRRWELQEEAQAAEELIDRIHAQLADTPAPVPEE